MAWQVLGLVAASWIGLTPSARGQDVRDITLEGDAWSVRIDPASLRVDAVVKGNNRIVLSSAQSGLGPVENLKHGRGEAHWDLPQARVSVRCRLRANELSVGFACQQAGKFTWPTVNAARRVKAYILPTFEGIYVPSDDAKWIAFLAGHGPLNTTANLSMPFWGLDYGDNTITYILTNQFNNQLTFQDQEGKLGVRLTHKFTSNRKKKEYGVLVRLGDSSPVEPAKQYRRWLIEQGRFVSMAQKIRQVPKAERLLGAAHAYLWGEGLISRYDVRDWKGFCVQLKTLAETNASSPGKRIWELMTAEAWAAVDQLIEADWPYDYVKNQVATDLSRLLERRDFYDRSAWHGITVTGKAGELLKRDVAQLAERELYTLNCALLEAAFPGFLADRRSWGDGVSIKMLGMFADGGFDRLCLTTGGLSSANKRPEVAEKADALGYLFGPYDSYHSIHHPKEKDTWETAQFDLALYEAGPVVQADGTKRLGFKRKGYVLSPLAARPYVEKRVRGRMRNVPFNAWFIDCDAYGELFDDYSKLHPATQEDDMRARLGRMAWIRDTYKAVIGSEGGSGYAAGVIHFAHGMMTPVIGWGDPDLKDRKSPYWLGGYWPPDGPKTFVKQVPLKPYYRYFYYDPGFRLPLYQTVFHDSVIATHHWGNASLKFNDQIDTVELLELLYNVPPLYHMNVAEFRKHRVRMKAHFDFFSPLHRELALLPMTDFAWLSPDRMVQRTVFGDRVEIVGNFGSAVFEDGTRSIPARSVVAKWLDSDRTRSFTPGR